MTNEQVIIVWRSLLSLEPRDLSVRCDCFSPLCDGARVQTSELWPLPLPLMTSVGLGKVFALHPVLYPWHRTLWWGQGSSTLVLMRRSESTGLPPTYWLVLTFAQFISPAVSCTSFWLMSSLKAVYAFASSSPDRRTLNTNSIVLSWYK